MFGWYEVQVGLCRLQGVLGKSDGLMVPDTGQRVCRPPWRCHKSIRVILHPSHGYACIHGKGQVIRS